MFRRTKKRTLREAQLRATLVHISLADVDAAFDRARSQDDYIANLYELVLPGFEEALRIDGYPAANAATDSYILSRAEEFDRRYEPTRAPGFGWLNYRWEIDPRLADWEVSLAEVRVVARPAQVRQVHQDRRSV